MLKIIEYCARLITLILAIFLLVIGTSELLPILQLAIAVMLAIQGIPLWREQKKSFAFLNLSAAGFCLFVGIYMF